VVVGKLGGGREIIKARKEISVYCMILNGEEREFFLN